MEATKSGSIIHLQLSTTEADVLLKDIANELFHNQSKQSERLAFLRRLQERLQSALHG